MADFDMKSDEEKAEALKAWWASNGISVAAGVALTIGGMFGWNYYQESKLTAAEGLKLTKNTAIQFMRH